MNFVAQVEDHLRDLGSEARKHHPGVKEASERAILRLRSLQTQYVAAVRRASASTPSSSKRASASNDPFPPSSSAPPSTTHQHPTTALFRSQDVLRPFLLAANHPDATYSLLATSFDSIQLLLRGDAVCPEDAVHISRVLGIQAWGCARRLGLIGGGGVNANSSGGGGGGVSSSGTSSIAVGMIQAASSSVTGALGGITGMVLGGSSREVISGSTAPGNVNFANKAGAGGGGSTRLGSTASQHHQLGGNRTTKEDQSISLKILQTITMLVDSRSMDLSQDVLGTCLLACLLLGAGHSYVTGGLNKLGSTTHSYPHSLLGYKPCASSSVGSNGVGITNVGNASATEGTAGNVKRAALATMNQLVSIVYERAKDAMLESSLEPSKFSVLTVASLMLDDLCSLVGHFAQSRSERHLLGPFSIAGKEGLAPSPTTCLALLEMIFKQRCHDFFQLVISIYVENNNEKPVPTHGLEVATRGISKVCRLVLSILRTQQSEQQKPPANLSGSLSEDPSTPVDFIYFYHATVITSSIISSYLSATSAEFYAHLDSIIQNKDIEKNPNGERISDVIHQTISQLVKFVSGATDSYHKSDIFEDGYIFSQNERESLNIGKSPTSIGDLNHRNPSNRPSASKKSFQSIPDPLIPNCRLWRAFLSMGVLHQVVQSHLEHIACLDICVIQQRMGDLSVDDSTSTLAEGENNLGQCLESPLIRLIAEAVGDFATISASNRERILHVVLTAHDDHTTLPNSNANLDSKSTSTINRDDITSVNGFSTSTIDSSSSREAGPFYSASALVTKLAGTLNNEKIEIPICDSGAATWLAFRCIIALVHSTKEAVSAGILSSSGRGNESGYNTCETQPNRNHFIDSILNGSFAPSVSVLQHYIKRMYGSHVVVSQTLKSYEELAFASMAMDRAPDNLRRHAILTSLCKLCLPSWGKKRTNTQLKESNIDAIWTLIRIIHNHYEDIFDEWHAILSTLDQLSSISMSSTKLPDTYAKSVNDISSSFVRLPEFTTSFSSEALSHFVTSLIKLSNGTLFGIQTERSSNLSQEISGKLLLSENTIDKVDNSSQISDNFSRESSLGGKLISFAGRAFGGVPAQGSSGNNPPNPQRLNAESTDARLSKSYSNNLRETAFSKSATMKISTPRSVFMTVPLPLLLLTLVSEVNAYRFSVVEEAVAMHLCEVVSCSSTVELRSFAMDTLIHFMPLSLLKSETSRKFGRLPMSSPASDPDDAFSVVPISCESMSGKSYQSGESSQDELQLLKRLCQTIQSTSQTETANTGLNALRVVLEGAGHSLAGDNLVIVVETLSVLSGGDYFRNGSDNNIDRSTKAWANASAIAFQNLKLIVDDFLEPQSADDELRPKSFSAREAILDCCVSFGKSQHDINTSLTSIGMLWSLADQDSTPGTLDLVLSKLAYLALDNRAEVRNCSVNTLFSCVVGVGDQFSNDQWEKCLNKTILFGIMKHMSSAMNGTNEDSLKQNESNESQRYKVSVHHSRDSASKQWSTTLVLALRGLERVLRLFFCRLLKKSIEFFQHSNQHREVWLMATWKEILRISFDCACTSGERETLDLRLAGIELITLCSQVSCKAGIGAATNTARVGTNMEVVGGALRSVRAATTVGDKNQGSLCSAPIEPEVDQLRHIFFDLAFSKLVDFRTYLESLNGYNIHDTESPHVVDSVMTQVLTKLTGELSKLYECCKSDEMSPGSFELRLDLFVEEDDKYESQLVNLLLVILDNADADKNSRYLNQVQRGCISMLQTMASNSSLQAFKALAKLSGDSMFVTRETIRACNSTDDDASDDGYGEVLELEASKTVASAFDSGDMSSEAKIIVMCSVLTQYLKIHGLHNESGVNTFSRKGRGIFRAKYDTLTRVMDSGLEATARVDMSLKDKSVIDSIWDKIIDAVKILLLECLTDGYANNSKSILDIIALFLLHLPPRKYSAAGSVLEKGANRAIEVAFGKNEDFDEHLTSADNIVEGAIDIFLACFMGLCQKMPSSPALKSMTGQILGGTIESSDWPTGNSSHQVHARHKLALAVCESLKTTSSQDLLVATFPLLCRLTNVDNNNLREAAGQILSGINLADAISRERERAETAEAKAREIEEENNALLEEVDYLQAENEELQRQLAVFSESADFT